MSGSNDAPVNGLGMVGWVGHAMVRGAAGSGTAPGRSTALLIIFRRASLITRAMGAVSGPEAAARPSIICSACRYWRMIARKCSCGSGAGIPCPPIIPSIPGADCGSPPALGGPPPASGEPGEPGGTKPPANGDAIEAMAYRVGIRLVKGVRTFPVVFLPPLRFFCSIIFMTPPRPRFNTLCSYVCAAFSCRVFLPWFHLVPMTT